MRTSNAYFSIEDIRGFVADVLSDADPARSAELRLALKTEEDPLLDAAAREINPQTVVDCGCGSGRFTLARANVHALGLEHRIEVLRNSKEIKFSST